jgi:hypothetical protein
MLLECDFCEAIVDAKKIASHEYDEQFAPGEPIPWNSKVTLVK